MSNIHTIRYDRYCIVCFLVWTWVWRYFSEIIVDIGMNRLPRRTQLSQKCWFLELLIKGHMCIIIAKLSYDYWQFPIHWFDVALYFGKINFRIHEVWCLFVYLDLITHIRALIVWALIAFRAQIVVLNMHCTKYFTVQWYLWFYLKNALSVTWHSTIWRPNVL